LKGIAHLSTSFVCGRKSGVFSEDDPGDGRDFSNSYEQTKWEAECLVRGFMNELPITIFRPSIVVGDSQSGRTIHFNVIYTPLRYIMAGQVHGLPCSPRTLLDVVAVDYVVDAIRSIFLRGQCWGTTYHLVASRRISCTVDEIISHALSCATRNVNGNDAPAVQYLNQEEYQSRVKGCRGREKLMCEMLRAFEPYINSQIVFSDSNTAAALDGTGISPPPVLDYLDTLLDYCFLSNWGRRLHMAA
jgi:long-chain acyl-CoA synthetase